MNTKSDDVILDLEDAVAPSEKESARDRVVNLLITQWPVGGPIPIHGL
jgi:citrate lyase beta subunit